MKRFLFCLSFHVLSWSHTRHCLRSAQRRTLEREFSDERLFHRWRQAVLKATRALFSDGEVRACLQGWNALFCLNNWDIFFRHWHLGCDWRLKRVLSSESYYFHIWKKIQNFRIRFILLLLCDWMSLIWHMHIPSYCVCQLLSGLFYKGNNWLFLLYLFSRYVQYSLHCWKKKFPS